MTSVTPEDIANLLDALGEVLRSSISRIPDSIPVKVATDYQRIVPQENGYRTEPEIRMTVVGSTSLTVDMDMMANAAPILDVVRSSPALQAIFLVDAAKNPVNGDAQTTWLRNTLIAKFVHLYLDGCDRLEWNSDAFDQAALNLRTFLDAPDPTLVIATGLCGVDLEDERVAVTSEVSLVRLDLDGKQELFDRMSGEYFTGRQESFSVVNLDALIEQEIALSSHEPYWIAQKRADDQMQRLVAAIRLLAQGLVRPIRQWSHFKEPWFGLGGGSSYRPIASIFIDPVRVAVAASTAPTLTKRLNQLEFIADDGLDLALRRFGYAYDRSLLEDRYLDYWIALEALFSQSGEESETTDKVSRRMARLLGANQADRRGVKSEVKRLYGVRSRVVHGSSVERSKIEASLMRVGALLRESLCRRLDDGWSVDSLEDEMMK